MSTKEDIEQDSLYQDMDEEDEKNEQDVLVAIQPDPIIVEAKANKNCDKETLRLKAIKVLSDADFRRNGKINKSIKDWEMTYYEFI